MDEFVLEERDKGNGKTETVKLPLKMARTHADIEAGSHPKAEGVLITIGGTRHGMSLEVAEALQEALKTAIKDAKKG